MSEQLTMDLFADNPPTNEAYPPREEKTYEALDHQLSDLLHELNGDQNSGEKNPILKHCTLEISQHTREGQIAIECSTAQQEELLKTHVVGEAGDYKPLILDNGYLYLRRYWQYQQQLAEQIKSRLEIAELDEDWAQERLSHYFSSNIDASDSENKNDEIDWQKVAAEHALQNQFLIVSGGPGTGKTTTITKILALLIELHNLQGASKYKSSKKGGGGLNNNHLNILLAAPTGKASIRMLDAISEVQNKLELSDDVKAQMPTQASTLHKLLGFIPEKVIFKHNCNNPLNADVVLVDEASMIDIAMMSKLIEAVPRHAKLILIGDKDQLSSVETGSVFADMCEGLNNNINNNINNNLSNKEKNPLSPAGGGLGRGENLDGNLESQTRQTHIVTLQKNYRFKKGSTIGQLALTANKGDSKTLLETLKDETKIDCNLLSPSILAGKQLPNDLTAPWDNYFKILNSPNSTITEIFKAFNEYRILCALRRGLNGSTTLSTRIETSLAKKGLIRQRASFGQAQAQNWYHGRPVMITQNSYSKGLFNGDTGITLTRNSETKVYFPSSEEGEFKSYAPVRLPAHETTWAMTIHKSQGSEFNQVLLVLPHEVMPLLTRQLIYTGITRAKEQVNIVASDAVLNAGVKTEMVKATRIADML